MRFVQCCQLSVKLQTMILISQVEINDPIALCFIQSMAHYEVKLKTLIRKIELTWVSGKGTIFLYLEERWTDQCSLESSVRARQIALCKWTCCLPFCSCLFIYFIYLFIYFCSLQVQSIGLPFWWQDQLLGLPLLHEHGRRKELRCWPQQTQGILPLGCCHQRYCSAQHNSHIYLMCFSRTII